MGGVTRELLVLPAYGICFFSTLPASHGDHSHTRHLYHKAPYAAMESFDVGCVWIGGSGVVGRRQGSRGVGVGFRLHRVSLGIASSSYP